MASTGLSGPRALAAPGNVLPNEPWRLAAVVIGLVGVVLTATGIPANALFDQPGTGKQVATIAAPVILLACALVRDPLRVPMALVIIGLPLITYTATFGPVAVSAVLPPILLAALIATLTPGKARLVSPRLLIVFALLLAPVVLAREPGTQIELIALVVVLIWLVRRTAVDDSGLKFVLMTLVVACALQALLGIWQAQTGERLSLYSGTSSFGSDYFFSFGDVNRPTAAFFDPISFGNVLAMAIPIAASLAIALRPFAQRVAAAAAAAAMVTALILTLSRMSWVGAGVGLIVTIAVLPGRMRIAALAGTAVVLAATFSIAVGMAGTDLIERAQSLSDPTSAGIVTGESDRGRVRIWSAALDVWQSHPISGVGLGDLGDEFIGRVGFGSGPGGHAHSVYLQTLATAGILGALALLLLTWELARRTIGALRAPIRNRADRERRIMVAGIAGALAALVIVCGTDTTARYEQVAGLMAIVLGCALALDRRTGAT